MVKIKKLEVRNIKNIILRNKNHFLKNLILLNNQVLKILEGQNKK